jgi:CRISPR-associated protein Csx3
MTTYRISADAIANGVLLRLSFGEAAQNDVIVKDAVAALEALGLTGGKTVFLNGPASLPVAVAIAHGVVHKFGEVAVFDPKLNAYVVAVSHGGRAVGSLVNPE